MSASAIQPELVSLQSKLAGEIAKDVREYELIAKRIEKNRELLHAVNASLGVMLAQATGHSTMTDTIRAAIKALPTPTFTPTDVDQSLTQHFPTIKIDKESVRSALWNMMKRGEIRCIRKGNNRLAAQYERSAELGGANDHHSEVVPRKRSRTVSRHAETNEALAGVNGDQS